MTLIKSLVLSTLLVASLSAREQVNINFSDLQIKDFIKLVSKVTHKNILINYRITGNVDFVSSAPIYNDELLDILIAILESKGFTLVEDGSMYKVIRSSEAAKHNTKVISSSKKPDGALMVTYTIKVENENVDIVAAKIRYLISKTAKLMTMKESNTILITDYPQNIATVKKVIKNLNLKSKNIVKIIEVKHTNIKQLKSHLDTIIKSIFNAKIVEQKINILINDNSNGLIVIGSKENVKIIEDLVQKLDKEALDNKGIQIFHLKNSDAKSVLASINAIISKQVYKDKDQKPHVSASVDINAIIVVGDPMAIKGIKMIIDELDKEKYQVYVKAKIVEISKQKTDELGIRYGFAGGAAKEVSANGIYAMSANIGTIGQQAEGVRQLTKKTFALLATLNFLEAHGASNTVSNPSILCINNKESSIYVGKKIYVPSSSTVGTSGIPVTNYKPDDVGLKLKIKPRVSSTDKVSLNVAVVLESYQGLDANNNPTSIKQEVKTEIILRNGEDILIGGLVKKYTNKQMEKVPLLGDIPWLGKWLFTYSKEERVKDNLIIILTPYILDKSEQLSQLQLKLGEIANEQAKYNQLVLQKMEKKVLKKQESEE